MVTVSYTTQVNVADFGFDWTTANFASILNHPLSVATATDLRWAGGSGAVTWTDAVTGTGMTSSSPLTSAAAKAYPPFAR